MTYKEARVYLDEMSRYGSVLGLDSIRGLLRELGNPQDNLKFIHIAGTNGKGSVLAYTSTILSEAGYRTGRYVSPTVVAYLERIQIDGMWIPEEKFAENTAKVRDAIVRLEAAGKPVPTVFEAETAIAFLYFCDMKCDFVVLEAGLGGALDATNIIRNTVCAVFTPISRDHIGVIGNTVEEIAENKAGIIKPGCMAVSAAQTECVAKVLRDCMRKNGRMTDRTDEPEFFQAEPEKARITMEDSGGVTLSYKEFEDIHTAMAGEYQKGNLITALEVVRALRAAGYAADIDAVRRGAEKTVWPGRFERIGEKPEFILDGAHNEDAALKLRASVERYFPGRRLLFIMGVFRDKEYERIAQIMCPLAASVYTVELPDRRRGLPARELAETAGKYCKDVRAFQEEEANGRGCSSGWKDSGSRGAVSDWKDSRNRGAMSGGEDSKIREMHCHAGESIRKAAAAAMEAARPDDVILAFGSLSYLQNMREAYEDIVKQADAWRNAGGFERKRGDHR